MGSCTSRAEKDPEDPLFEAFEARNWVWVDQIIRRGSPPIAPELFDSLYDSLTQFDQPIPFLSLYLSPGAPAPSEFTIFTASAEGSHGILRLLHSLGIQDDAGGIEVALHFALRCRRPATMKLIFELWGHRLPLDRYTMETLLWDILSVSIPPEAQSEMILLTLRHGAEPDRPLINMPRYKNAVFGPWCVRHRERQLERQAGFDALMQNTHIPEMVIEWEILAHL